jgi:thiol-disulfide isomerase/thioredoxin
MIEVNKNTLKDLTSKNERVFVYFYTEWDGYSKMMFPNLTKLQSEIDVPIVICNIDYNYDLGTEFKVRGLPTFGLVYNGEIIRTDSSVQTIDYIKEFIFE